MDHPKISVVIPIYNVEKYLDRCLISVVNQSYHNLEIILVEDGSLDNCPQMCDEWAEKDDRIRVIHKKNAGLGMARNTGIEYASGDYICFIDSDDYIALDTIDKAWEMANEAQAELVFYGCNMVDASERVTAVFRPESGKRVFKGAEFQDILLPDIISPDFTNKQKYNVLFSACTVLFSMETIRQADWRFVSEREIISEDVFSLMKLFASVQRVAIVPEALYYYCQNSCSLTRTCRSDRYQEIKDFYDKMIILCDTYRYSELIKTRFSGAYLAFVIGALKTIVQCDLSFGKKIRMLKDIAYDPHLKQTLEKNDWYIENRSRRLIGILLLKKKIMLCYIVLWVRCKIKK